MMEHNDQTELLNMLVQICGCRFVSDLPIAKWRTRLLEAVANINSEDYSTEAWQYAAQYITGGQFTQESEGEPTALSVQQALHNWLLAYQESQT